MGAPLDSNCTILEKMVWHLWGKWLIDVFSKKKLCNMGAPLDSNCTILEKMLWHLWGKGLMDAFLDKKLLNMAAPLDSKCTFLEKKLGNMGKWVMEAFLEKSCGTRGANGLWTSLWKGFCVRQG